MEKNMAKTSNYCGTRRSKILKENKYFHPLKNVSDFKKATKEEVEISLRMRVSERKSETLIQSSNQLAFFYSLRNVLSFCRKKRVTIFWSEMGSRFREVQRMTSSTPFDRCTCLGVRK